MPKGMSTTLLQLLLMGWYRFTGAAGLAMPDSCQREGSRCDASGAGWINGNHPTAAEEVVARSVCFSHGGSLIAVIDFKSLIAVVSMCINFLVNLLAM